MTSTALVQRPDVAVGYARAVEHTYRSAMAGLTSEADLRAVFTSRELYPLVRSKAANLVAAVAEPTLVCSAVGDLNQVSPLPTQTSAVWLFRPGIASRSRPLAKNDWDPQGFEGHCGLGGDDPEAEALLEIEMPRTRLRGGHSR